MIKQPWEKQQTWQDKAHSLIYAECQGEYLRTNTLPNGQKRKRYVPWGHTELAAELYECIKKNDEEQAKVIFLRLNLPPL